MVVAAVLCEFSISAFCGEIHDAVENGDLAKVGALLAANPQLINSTTEGGSTPLHLAAAGRNVDAAKLLANAGANLNAKTKEGATPLHWAAYVDAVEVAQLLIDLGADVNQKNGKGQSAFQVAVKENASNVAKLLADKTKAAYNEAFLDSTLASGEKAMESGELPRAYEILGQLVRKDPGNPRVNFAFGMACRSLNDLSRAELAFERVLQATPDNDRARFELARIYIDRKEIGAAQRELAIVLAHNPPPDVREYANRYMSNIKESEKKFKMSARIDVGVVHDDNVNVGPNSETIAISPVFFGAQTIDSLTVDTESQPLSADGAFGSAVIMSAYDAGEAGKWMVNANGSVYANVLSDAEDYQSLFYQLQAGMRYWGKNDVYVFPITAGHVDYGQEALVDIVGGGAQHTHVWGPQSDWQCESLIRGDYRDYSTLYDRNGAYLFAGETLRHYFGARRHMIGLSVSVSHDYTDAAVFENTALDWGLSGEARLPAGFSLYGKVRYGESDYSEREVLAPDKRSDTFQQFSVGITKAITGSWGVDLSHTGAKNESTFGLYSYDRNVTSLSTYFTF